MRDGIFYQLVTQVNLTESDLKYPVRKYVIKTFNSWLAWQTISAVSLPPHGSFSQKQVKKLV